MRYVTLLLTEHDARRLREEIAAREGYLWQFAKDAEGCGDEDGDEYARRDASFLRGIKGKITAELASLGKEQD